VVLTPPRFAPVDGSRRGDDLSRGEAAQHAWCPRADLRGPIHVVASGNPGLATGGSGDLLAGFIGAFLARGSAGPRPPRWAPMRWAGRGARRAPVDGSQPASRRCPAALPEIWRA